MKAIFSIGALVTMLSGTVLAQSIQQQRMDAARKEAAKQQPQQPQQGKASFTVPNQEAARKAAEITYNTWRLSMIRGNEQAWRSATATSRQVKVRNMIISRRGRFPHDFFSRIQEAPKLEDFHYVGALTGCNGNTMACTYVGMLQLGAQAKAHPNAFVLLFVNEGGKWKLDQTRFFDLSKLPDVLKRLEKQDITVLQEQDGFHPYTAVPATPKACNAPELIGQVFVDCPGRSVDVTINGISLHDFYDERRADIISGGLRRGKNTIAYTIKDNAGQDHPALAIGLFVMPETKGNKPVCVFDHILDGSDTAMGGSFTFTIENGHIASMNPNFKGAAPQPFHAVPLKPKEETPKK